MYPYIEVFNAKIPTYTLCAGLGLIVSSTLVCCFLMQKQMLTKYISVVFWSLLGLFIGAKLFGVASRVLNDLYNGGSFDLLECLDSGIVYYGGLIGFIITIKLLCVKNKLRFDELSGIVAFCIPLFHFFGRLGCFFGGCCYGKVSTGLLSIPYRIGFDGRWKSRYPTQLFEAGFELVVFGVIVYCYIKNKCDKNKLLDAYLLCYATFRFINEFFRGDELRGVFGFISFSQVISILVVIYICLKYYSKGMVKDEKS